MYRTIKYNWHVETMSEIFHPGQIPEKETATWCVLFLDELLDFGKCHKIWKVLQPRHIVYRPINPVQSCLETYEKVCQDVINVAV